MKHVVSFSGGRTSAYLCKVMIDTFGRENVDFIYMDTGAEHPKTYGFIKRVNEHFNLNLTCLQGDFNQPVGEGHTYNVVDINELKHDPANGVYGQLMKKYGVPTLASAWCTSRMKEETHDKYCDDKYGKENYITWIGIRADEPNRLNIGKNPLLRYMAEITDFEKQDVIHWWSKMPFDLEIDEHLGNCVFCFKKGHSKIALAARDEPELLAQWKESINQASDRLSREKEKDGGLLEPYIEYIEKGVMYRNRKKVDDVIAMFSMFDDNELRDTVYRNTKNSGGCSESCEVFACQAEMF